VVAEYRCGKCGRVYTEDEYRKLERVLFDPDHPNLGLTSKCSCGYVFHRDRWRIRTDVEVDTPRGKRIFTVHSEFIEIGEPDDQMWYETTVLTDSIEFLCFIVWKHRTKEEAMKVHEEVVNAIRNGNYTFSANTWYFDVFLDRSARKSYWEEFMDYISCYYVSEDDKDREPEEIADILTCASKVDPYYEQAYLELYAGFIEHMLEKVHGIKVDVHVVRLCTGNDDEYCYEIVVGYSLHTVKDGKKYEHYIVIYRDRIGLPLFRYGSSYEPVIDDFNSKTDELLGRIKEHYDACKVSTGRSWEM
jgi:hypothetical protein